jgi:hypothetical protein
VSERERKGGREGEREREIEGERDSKITVKKRDWRGMNLNY